MKLIEAMRKVKTNKEKIKDLQEKVALNCANLSNETPLYGEKTRAKIQEWLQAIEDVSKDNVVLLTRIQKTNLLTVVTMELAEDVKVTRTIAEWIWRRREYAGICQSAWRQLTNRKLKEGMIQDSQGKVTEIKIVYHFDPELRDKKIAMYRDEPHIIDSTLEIVNAVTDLAEL